MTKPEINVGMRVQDRHGMMFEVTETYGNEIELDGEHYVSRETLITDIQTGRTEVIEK